MKSKPRIAIAGAGPGGLTLARILHLQGVHATVFEREEHYAVRPQGGTLDMHAETGQFALRAAGLESEFKRLARYEDQGSRVYNKHGHLLHEDTDLTGDRPEIDRAHLRQILLDSLPAETIRWNHSLAYIEPQADQTYHLRFQHGLVEPVDLIIGGDGAWSRVRPLVSDARPIYCGISFVEIEIEDADGKHPKIAQLVGHGKIFALGDSKGLIAQRNANGHIFIYAGLRVPENAFASGLTKQALAEHFAGWSADLLQLIQQAGERITPRGIYTLAAGHRWTHRPGVTLIGDAAHLMSPFSGEGANLAMRDGADLAHTLIASTKIEDFETAMCGRAEEAARGANQGIEEAFSEDGLAHVLRQMQSHHAA